MESLVYKNSEGKPVTNSLLVAEKFEKNHKDVIRSIQNLMAQNCAVRNMFVETTYISERGRNEPMFVMNRDGFSLLVMGFNGKEALKFKLDFIGAFNRMEEILMAAQDNEAVLSEDSARRRWLLANEKKQLNATITNCMKRLKEVNRELNQINFDDFTRLGVKDILCGNAGRIPFQFPNKGKMLKIS
jgi:Rha family phage regulatory protein